MDFWLRISTNKIYQRIGWYNSKRNSKYIIGHQIKSRDKINFTHYLQYFVCLDEILPQWAGRRRTQSWECRRLCRRLCRPAAAVRFPAGPGWSAAPARSCGCSSDCRGSGQGLAQRVITWICLICLRLEVLLIIIWAYHSIYKSPFPSLTDSRTHGLTDVTLRMSSHWD